MVKIAPPRQSVVRLFFVVVALRIFSDIFAVSKILAENSPAGSPSNGDNGGDGNGEIIGDDKDNGGDQRRQNDSKGIESDGDGGGGGGSDSRFGGGVDDSDSDGGGGVGDS